MMLGQHLLKSWSSTQNVVALSSGEAEYYGLVKGAAQGIGARNMMQDIRKISKMLAISFQMRQRSTLKLQERLTKKYLKELAVSSHSLLFSALCYGITSSIPLKSTDGTSGGRQALRINKKVILPKHGN